MRFLTSAASTLTAVVALMLIGCGGSPTTPPLAQSGAASPFVHRPFEYGAPTASWRRAGTSFESHSAIRPSFMDLRSLKKPLVFVSDRNGDVDIFLQSGKKAMVGQITGFTNGASLFLATDSADDLYVTDAYSNSLIVYAPPYTKGPKLTITARGASTLAVSRKGTVAVLGCTIPSGSQCGYGFLFYAAGSTAPCAKVLVPSSFPQVWGAGFDHNGNLYFDNYSSTTAPVSVGKIKGDCNAKKVQTLTTTNEGLFPADVKVTKAGQIAIMESTGTYPYTTAIDTYNTPNHGSLGNPVSTTPLPGGVFTISGEFAFQASGRNFWVGIEGAGPSYAGEASEFAYPAGGTPKRTVILGPPESSSFGVAVTPVLVP